MQHVRKEEPTPTVREGQSHRPSVFSRDTKEKKDCSKEKTRISPAVQRLPKAEKAKAEKRTQKVKVVSDHHNSSAFAFVLTVVYLAFVLTISVIFSVFAIDVANEAFALNAKGDPITVTITGEYLTVSDIAEQLHLQHVIDHQKIFTLYARLRHKDNQNFTAGTATVTPEMGYDALLKLFVPQPEPRKEIAVAVPEGYTVDDIISLFVSKGIGTREAFEYVINEYPLSTEDYWFLEGVDCSHGRIYRLEGYLYPDTYFFYDSYPDKEDDIPGTAGAKAVIFKMLNEFNKNFKKSYFTKYKTYIAKHYPDAPEMTLDQIITLASILEKEGLAAERFAISAVFYNRLSNPAYEGIEGKLESNATVQYALKHDGYDISLEFGEFEKNYPSPYNSYLYAGLPPGPIVSPTIDSINAALYPLANCPYYFFVATDSGYSFFAQTLAEHKINVERARNGEVANPYGDDEDWGDDDYNE